jgi:hypothetical protein
MNEVVPTERTLAIVAHQGMMELLDAKWELNSGRTVKLRIVDNPEAPLIVNPFTQFVRRRGNRVGTRFEAAFVRYGEGRPFFKGEMMLAGGGQPLGQGMWVKFWLDDESDHHPFAGCAGRKGVQPGDLFGVVMVELDDDDVVIDQAKRRRVEGKSGGALARFAALLCSNQLFLQYLSEKMPVGLDPSHPVSRSAEWWGTEDRAARWIRWMCSIESRAELDNNAKAAEMFHERIRRPYSEWRGTSED